MSSHYVSFPEYSKNPFVDESPRITVVVNNNISTSRNNIVEEVGASLCACCLLSWLLSPFHIFRIF